MMTTDAEAAREMLEELRRSRLVVVLVPACRGEGMLRAAVETNPPWYSDLCASYPTDKPSHRRRWKHSDTLIKRCHIERALECIAAGQQPTTVTAWRLRPYIEHRREEIENPTEWEPAAIAAGAHL